MHTLTHTLKLFWASPLIDLALCCICCVHPSLLLEHLC